jgi:hypothetical protein
VARVLLGLLSLIVLITCTAPSTEGTRKKEPAEIPLPPKGADTFKKIDKALAKFAWGPAHDAPCQGCGESDDVTIRYTGMTKDIKPGNGPAKLRIVALIQNWSNQDVTHTPSGTTFKANTRYLMWVHSKNSQAVWGFIELGDGYDPNPKPIGLLALCGHKPPSVYDDANFQDCNDPYVSRGGIKTAYAATLMAAAISKPTWVSCDPDCCTGTTSLAIAPQ